VPVHPQKIGVKAQWSAGCLHVRKLQPHNEISACSALKSIQPSNSPMDQGAVSSNNPSLVTDVAGYLALKSPKQGQRTPVPAQRNGRDPAGRPDAMQRAARRPIEVSQSCRVNHLNLRVERVDASQERFKDRPGPGSE
jgi:hypothetical protein